jgi:uncharacterized protein YdeI (YjbR/CyaY-like superfamily)
MKPTFFKTPVGFRSWLRKHHASASELWVGFYKRDSGRPSITWPESVAEALCFGWIDGVRKRIDEMSYTIRFSPRRKGSVWSSVNIKLAKQLIEQGRMQSSGSKAFEARKEYRSGIYSYEQRPAELEAPYARLLKKNPKAWRFFQAQPPYYRKAISWWIVCAKKEETRLRRLKQLIEVSSSGQWIPGMARPGSRR